MVQLGKSKGVMSKGISSRTRTLITIAVFLLSLFVPFLWIVAILLMWFWTDWPKLVKIALTLPLTIIVLVTVFLISYVSFVRPFQVAGDSMNPSYKANEYLLTGIVHNAESLKRGDVIMFRMPTDTSKDSMRRVIGLPGDKVRIEIGEVYINNQKLNEPYLSGDTHTYGEDFLQEGFEVTVPVRSYFVLADNRQNSSDSREYGFITNDKIISKVLFCYWNCK